jgi:hypothetical protein
VAASDPSTQELLTLLDRLEELREDMLDLGITSFAQLEERIDALDRQIADAPDGDDDGSL